MQKTNLTTSDGLKLAGLVWEGKGPVSIILMHMMPANKESWTVLAEHLSGNGYNVLAFDFRGHGESEGGSYEDFSDDQHQKYSLDLETAVNYINENFPGTEIYLGGASIGANIAIQYMAAHPEIKKTAALSAGLNYYGVDAEQSVKQTDPSQDLLLIAAADDMRKSGTSSSRQAEMLYDLANCKKEKILFQAGGHGTHLLAAHPELLATIQDFFDN
jgi:alpha-beta hydrolase superfamily lysophospholipase